MSERTACAEGENLLFYWTGRCSGWEFIKPFCRGRLLLHRQSSEGDSSSSLWKDSETRWTFRSRGRNTTLQQRCRFILCPLVYLQPETFLQREHPTPFYSTALKGRLSGPKTLLCIRVCVCFWKWYTMWDNGVVCVMVCWRFQEVLRAVSPWKLTQKARVYNVFSGV